MNLHICTISSRNEFLEQIHDSIPWSENVIWHIARAVSNPINSEILSNNPRVRVHHLTCDDTDTPFKMNYIFKHIIDTDSDSYFCILDDDTLFHDGMYSTYWDYFRRNGKFMIIGQQVDKDGIMRLPATLPCECAIDSGNVLCHSHVLVPEQWPDKHWNDKFHADYDFWYRCYKHFRLANTDLVQEVISVYNALSNQPDTLNYVRKSMPVNNNV